MDSVDTFNRTEVLKIQRPAPEWIPLQHAPFLFQAVLRRRQSLTQLRQPNPGLLSRRLIDAIVQESVQDPAIGRCRVDREEYRFVLFEEIGELDPDAASQPISRTVTPFALPADWTKDPTSQRLAEKISSTWRMMEARLRRAIDAGYCRVLARCGAAYAPSFSELLPEIFARCRIADWQNGEAESASGSHDRLYDLHVAPNRSVEEFASLEINDLTQVASEPAVPDNSFALQGEHQPPSSVRISELAELTGRFKGIGLDVARYYYFEPEARPVGKPTRKIDKNKLREKFGREPAHQTIAGARELLKKLREKNATLEELDAIGFRPLPAGPYTNGD